MPSDSATYGSVISRNVVAARARARLKQSELAARMRALGYSWHPQTVGEVENGRRRVTAEEMLGLAIALKTAVHWLMTPAREDEQVTLPSGEILDWQIVYEIFWGGYSASWEGDVPHFPALQQPAREGAMAVPPPMARRSPL